MEIPCCSNFGAIQIFISILSKETKMIKISTNLSLHIKTYKELYNVKRFIKETCLRIARYYISLVRKGKVKRNYPTLITIM